MGHEALTEVAEAVLQHIRNAGGVNAEGLFLVALPVYLDAEEVHRLQLEVNRRSATYVKLEHRPGERRVGVQLLLSRLRR